jgi:hypothetical protein
MAARKEQSEPAARASVNIDELRELIALLRDNGLAELELESADFRVRLRREGAGPSVYSSRNCDTINPGPCTHAFGLSSGISRSGLTPDHVADRRHLLSFAFSHGRTVRKDRQQRRTNISGLHYRSHETHE